MRTETASVGSRSRPFTLVAVSLGFGVVQLDVTIVNTAIASIGKSLGGTITSLQWIVSIYTITFAALIRPSPRNCAQSARDSACLCRR
jgi:MFS transporter, DHA2 family, methylenomycin A resistance protein